MRVLSIILLLAAASPAAARPAPPPQVRQVERHRRGPPPGVVRRVHAPRVMRVRPVVLPPVRVVHPRTIEVRPAPYVRGMDPWQFDRLLGALREQPFGDDRLLVIELAARDHLFSVDQVIALLDSLTFGSEKLDALRLLAPLIVDPENRFEIVGAFTFGSEKREAAALLA